MMIRRYRAFAVFTFAAALAAVLVLSVGSVALAATTPTNAYPGNGATVPLTASNGWFYDFRWTPASGYGFNALSYSISVYTLGNEPVLTQIVWAPATSYKSTVYGLPPGSYKWSVTQWCELATIVTSPQTTFTVPRLPVTNPIMRLTPMNLAFSAVQGAGNPAAKSLTLGCIDPPATGWTWQTHNEQLAPWVTETYSGAGNTASYQVNTAGLAPGTYTTTMQVEMWKGPNSSYGHVLSSPYAFPITLTITPKGTIGPTGSTSTLAISKPSVSPSKPKHGKYAAFSTVVTPGVAASGTSTKLLLYRQETKTVKRRVRGKMRKVKVKYWRLRSTVPMTAGAVGASTTFTTRCKLKYAGKWQAVASFGGGGGYSATKSSARSFTVK